MNLRKFILVGLIFVLSGPGSTNVFPGNLETVEVDLKNLEFKDPLPFDVPFNIKGKITPEVRKVVVIYSITDQTKKKRCNYVRGRGEWARKGKEDHFKVTEIGPLHPKIEYSFKFEIYNKVKKGDEVLKQLFKIFYKEVKTITYEQSSVGSALCRIKCEINNYISKKNIKFLDAKGNRKQFEIDWKILRKLLMNHWDIESLMYSVNKIKISSMINLGKLYKKSLYKKIYCILKNPDGLDEPFKHQWNKPLCPHIQQYKFVTMAEVARMFADALQPKIYDTINDLSIYRILSGEAKIDGNEIIPYRSLKESKKIELNEKQVDAGYAELLAECMCNEGIREEKKVSLYEYLDIDSVKLLLGFLKKINSPTFRFKGKTLCQMFNNNSSNKEEIKTIFSDIKGSFRQFLEKLAKKQKYQEQFENIENEFSKKILKDVFFQENVVFSGSPEVITAESDQSDYIALDFGIGYAPRIRSPFLYVGANFYFVPVNKKAPLKLKFKERHWFGKRFSLLVGLTSIGIENGSNKNLFSGGSLIIGGGLRIGELRILKSIKVSGGGLLFKQIDENPLVDTEHVKLTHFVSISFDINILPLLGNIKKLF